MKKKKALWLVLVTALFGISVPMSAKAEEREKISKVRLEFSTTIQPGDSEGSVDVTVPDENAPYQVKNYEILNEPEYWSESNSPLVQVEVSTDGDEYYFSGVDKNMFKLSLDKKYDDIKRAEYVKAKREDDKTSLTVTVRLKFDGDKGEALSVEEVFWEMNTGADGTSQPTGYAAWYNPADTSGSRLQVEVNGTWNDAVLSTTADRYSLISYITAPGKYRFRVQNVMIGGTKSGWKTSKRLLVTADMFRGLGGGFQRAADRVRWWWRNPDGSFAANEWKLYEKKWYWFDAEGYMATGWQNISGSWYYLDAVNGDMYVKRKTPDGYRVGADGKWVQ